LKIKENRDPTVNLRAAINDLEQGRIDPDLLKVKIKLTKNPADYAVHNANKRIGKLLEAKAGDVMSHYKIDKRVSINSGNWSLQI
jgi:hypothetical protein